jgi:hypothetical protein
VLDINSNSTKSVAMNLKIMVESNEEAETGKKLCSKSSTILSVM